MLTKLLLTLNYLRNIMFDKIWQDFHQQLLAFIIGKVGDKALAEDILQEVFIKVHKNIDAVNEIKQLNAWLYQICRHAIIDHYRSKKNDTGQNDDEIAKLVAVEESSADQVQLNTCIGILIADLPEQYRNILLASELEQEKQQSIAEKQQLSLTAVKSRIKRGRQQLKQKLQACCDFEFKENGPEAICKSQCGCST